MKKIIFCPLCLKKGHQKILGAVDDGARGTVYLWCKEDKKEVKIQLDKLEPLSRDKNV